jgi:GR25 family glycosyltransferase involved in LPS biosynthesis
MVTWNGIKIADRGFLINLEERKDRLNESLKEFEKNNIVGVERFNAVRLENEPNFLILSCAQSHLEVLKIQVKENIDRIIIFEDDFFLDVCYNLKNEKPNNVINDCINTINETEFDLLYLGVVLISKSEKYELNLIKPKKTVQTTCYISSLEFAKYVTETFDFRNETSLVYGEQIDTFYSVLSSKDHWKMERELFDRDKIINNNLKIFSYIPILFNQRASYSNISNLNVNYTGYNILRNNMFYP